jgi:serine/threonine-protein kinase
MRVVMLSQEVGVPDLRGRTVPEATGLTGRHELQLRVEGKRHDPSIPRDAVMDQIPPAGGTLKLGRSVRVWLSLGPQRVVVPSVVGDGLRTARLTLEQARLPLRRILQIPDASPAGTILMQDPAAGETDAALGSAVLVSLGPRSAAYVMPDLIGRSASAVVDGLQVAGLRVEELRTRSYPGAAEGTILRQIPAAGSRVSSSVGIVLDVAGGAP